MPAEPSERESAPAAAVASAGLESALRRLAAQLSEYTGLPTLIGPAPRAAWRRDPATGDTPSGDAPSGDAPSGDAPSGDAPSGDPGPADPGPADPDPAIRLETVRLVAPHYLVHSDISRVDAHVLVEAAGWDHAYATDRLATAMLLVLANSTWEVVPGEPSAELWRSLRRPARPAFLLSVPLTLPIARERAPLVREGLGVRSGPLRQVHGRVLAADGTPLSGARVRLRPGGRPTTTAHDGSWSLSLPALDVVLEASAHGAHTTRPLPASAGSEGRVDIVLGELGAQVPDPTATS